MEYIPNVMGGLDMKKISVLLKDIPYSCEVSDVANRSVGDIISDSRQVREGCLFICLRGEHSDGHDFALQAAKAGAAFVLSEMPISLPAGCINIVTPNTRRADALIWRNYYGDPASAMKVVAVTGTNGKTSITYMLKAILEKAGEKVGVIGTIRNYIGSVAVESNMTTPLPSRLYALIAEMRDAGCSYLVMEASSHALAFEKLAGIHPKIGIFTNLTPEHLDYHKNMENYAAAKAILFSMADCSVINYDTSYGAYMYRAATGKKIYVSKENTNADYYAANIVMKGIRGSCYECVTENERIPVACHIAGDFSLSNSLCAIAAAKELGISAALIEQAMEGLAGVDGRMEKVDLPCEDLTVIVDYAHTPDALENVLDAINACRDKTQRLVCIFGCGGDRDRTKRPVMGGIATKKADYTIITSDNSRTEDPGKIIDDILKGVDENACYTVITDRRTALEQAVIKAEKDDIILVAGKGHEDYEITAQGKRPFSEKAIIKAAYEKRIGKETEEE